MTLPMPADSFNVMTSLDQIAVGVAAACISQARPAAFNAAWRLAPAGTAVMALFWANPAPLLRHLPVLHQTLAPAAFALGAALCLPALSNLRPAESLPARLTTCLSRRSYGVYLTHVSIMEWAYYLNYRYQLPFWACALVAITGIIAVPALTWRWLEQPALRLRPGQTGAAQHPG